MSIVLLHGLGATRAVWRGFEGIAPDLPGHGAARWDPPYTFERYAEALLGMLPDVPVSVLGHSMGGVVGLALAALAPDRVRQVVGLGIKVTWSDEDLARAGALAGQPPRVFPTREAATQRFLRVSGLAGLIEPGDRMATSAVVAEGDGWRLAQDPRTFGVGAPDLSGLLASVTCPVTLARGEHDPLVTHAELAELHASAVTLPGLGHNAHVENPPAVLELLR